MFARELQRPHPSKHGERTEMWNVHIQVLRCDAHAHITLIPIYLQATELLPHKEQAEKPPSHVSDTMAGAYWGMLQNHIEGGLHYIYMTGKCLGAVRAVW